MRDDLPRFCVCVIFASSIYYYRCRRGKSQKRRILSYSPRAKDNDKGQSGKEENGKKREKKTHTHVKLCMRSRREG